MPAKRRAYIIRLSGLWYEVRAATQYPVGKITFAKLPGGDRESKQVNFVGGKVVCNLHYSDLYNLVAARQVPYFPDAAFPVVEVDDVTSSLLLNSKWRAKNLKRSA